jgi:hypothetical protein
MLSYIHKWTPQLFHTLGLGSNGYIKNYKIYDNYQKIYWFGINCYDCGKTKISSMHHIYTHFGHVLNKPHEYKTINSHSIRHRYNK